ncbi:MAG: peptidoglycan binding domain-containing protein, partial [Aeromicrobium sp.]
MTERPDEPDSDKPDVDLPEGAEPDADIDAALDSDAEGVAEPAIEHDLEPDVDEPVVEDELEEPVDEPEDPVVEDEPDEVMVAEEEPEEPVEEPEAVPTHAFDPDADSELALGTSIQAAVTDDEADDEGGSHTGRRILLGLLGLVAALYVAGYFLTGTRMPANATIGGVDVSGKSPSAARDAVDKALTPHIADEIVLSHDKKEFRIKPADAGLALNLDQSIEDAGGNRSWNPKDMAGLFFGDHETAPALDVDDAKLQSVIGTIGESVNVEVIEAQITFRKGKPTPREPKAGLVVARDDAADTIAGAYLVTGKPVEVPTVVVDPAVDSEGLADAMENIAKPAVAGPVTLEVGDKKVSLPVTAFSSALVVRVEDNVLKPYIDPKKLAGPLTDSVTGLGKKAVDATVRIEKGKPVVVPGKEGVGLQPEEMAKKLLPVIDKSGDERKISITAKVVEPVFTTEDAKALKIKERVGKFDTQFPYAEYRNINQGRAAAILDGTIIKPGETFSFNK